MSKGEYYNVLKVVTGLQGIYRRLQGCPAHKRLLETDACE